MSADDPSIRCDCREVSAKRVQVASLIGLFLFGWVYAWFAFADARTAADVAHLCMGAIVAVNGVASLFRKAPLSRLVGLICIPLSFCMIAFDAWHLLR